MAFVLLPCDLPSWPSISRRLTALRSATTPATLTRGIYELYCFCNVSIEPDLGDLTLREEQFAGLEALLLTETEGGGGGGKGGVRGGGGGGGGGGDLFSLVLPTMIDLALSLKDVKPKEGLLYSLQQEGGEMVLERGLASSLLAHMFFCTLPRRTQLSHPTLTDPSFAPTLSALHRESQRVKVRALLQYFRVVSRTPPSGHITFSRKVMGSRNFKTLREWSRSEVQLCRVTTQQDPHSRTQQATAPALAVCFSSPHLALPALHTHTSQEVSLMYGSPELLVVAVLVERMEDNEAVQVEGALRISTITHLDSRPTLMPRKNVSGEGVTFVLLDPDDYSQSEVLQYEQVNLLRELNKAFLGFTQPAGAGTSSTGTGSGRGRGTGARPPEGGVFSTSSSDIVSVSRQSSLPRYQTQVSSNSSADDKKDEDKGGRKAEEREGEKNGEKEGEGKEEEEKESDKRENEGVRNGREHGHEEKIQTSLDKPTEKGKQPPTSSPNKDDIRNKGTTEDEAMTTKEAQERMDNRESEKGEGSVKKKGGIITKIKAKIRSRGSDKAEKMAKSRGSSSERGWRWGRREGGGEKGKEVDKRGVEVVGTKNGNRGTGRTNQKEEMKRKDEGELRGKATENGHQPKDAVKIKTEKQSKKHEGRISQHESAGSRRRMDKQELNERLDKVVAKQEELAERLKRVTEQQGSAETTSIQGSTDKIAAREGDTSLADDDESKQTSMSPKMEEKEDRKATRRGSRLSSKQESENDSFVTAPSTIRRQSKKGQQKIPSSAQIDIDSKEQIEAKGAERVTFKDEEGKRKTDDSQEEGGESRRGGKGQGEEEEDETAKLLNRVLRAIERLEKERPDLVEEATKEEEQQQQNQQLQQQQEEQQEQQQRKPKTIARAKGRPPIPVPRQRWRREEGTRRRGSHGKQGGEGRRKEEEVQEEEEGRGRAGRKREEEEEEEEEKEARLMSIRRGLLEKKIEEEIRPLTLRRGRMDRGRRGAYEGGGPVSIRDRRVLIKEEDDGQEPQSVRRARIIREIIMKREEKRKQEGEGKDPSVRTLTLAEKERIKREEGEALLKMKRKRLLRISEGQKPTMYFSCSDDMETRELPISPSQTMLKPQKRSPQGMDHKQGPRGPLQSLQQEEEQYYSACESLDPQEGRRPRRRGSRRRGDSRKSSFAERLKEALAREPSLDTHPHHHHPHHPHHTTPTRVTRQESHGFVLDLPHTFSTGEDEEEEEEEGVSSEEGEEGGKDGTTASSHYSFSSDYTSDLEAVYEDLGAALQDMEEGQLGPRTAAVARFAHGLFKRALSESYKDVTLGLDGTAVKGAEGGAGGGVGGGGKGVQLPPRSLSLSERRHPNSPSTSLLHPTSFDHLKGELAAGRPVVTGNWGCGSFRGHHQLKAMIQWAAASEARAPKMIYYTCGHPNTVKLGLVCRLLSDRGWSVGQLVAVLLLHSNSKLESYRSGETELTESADSSLPESQRYKCPSQESMSLFAELMSSDCPQRTDTTTLDTEL